MKKSHEVEMVGNRCVSRLCVRDDGDGRAMRSAVNERRGALREIRFVVI